MTAGDVRYGRQGGGWVASGFTPGDGVADIDKIRRRTKKAHKTDAAKNPPWPDLEKISRTFTPTSDEEWEGRARMARARLAAGVPLDAIDDEALARAERNAS